MPPTPVVVGRCVLIEVFSDVVCPWCYIGKRRLEQALAEFPHAEGVEVLFRSFQLDPSTPKDSDQSLEEMLSTKYGTSRDEAREMNQRVSDIAAGVGLRYDLAAAHPANTFDAHRLLHFAAANGRQAELKERSDAGVLHRRPADRRPRACWPRWQPRSVWTTTRLPRCSPATTTPTMCGPTSRWPADFGANGVPFFVFDRRYGVSGAQETDVFRQVLDQAWAEREPIVTASPE